MVEWEAHVEEAVNSTASPDIHSRCWLDLVEPGPAALGVGFSCLFLQVWCLMLIPPHVPWVLSKHAGAGDSAGKAALPPAHTPPPAFLYFYLPSWPTHPPALQYCDERLLFLSLPVIRAAMLNPYPPESLLPLRSFFPPLFHFFHSFRLLSPPGFEPFWQGVMFTLLLRGLWCSAAVWERPVVTLVTQSCSAVM